MSGNRITARWAWLQGDSEVCHAGRQEEGVVPSVQMEGCGSHMRAAHGAASCCGRAQPAGHSQNPLLSPPSTTGSLSQRMREMMPKPSATQATSAGGSGSAGGAVGRGTPHTLQQPAGDPPSRLVLPPSMRQPCQQPHSSRRTPPSALTALQQVLQPLTLLPFP